MEEWKEYRLGDVCKTISDTYKGEAQYVILINTSDVLEGKCLNHQKTPNKNLKGQFKKTFKKNDVLYSEIRPANKRYAYIDFEPSDYIASTKLMVIRHNEKILPLYLFYILKSQEVVEELQMLAESRSGTFPQITFDEVANMKIKLPSIEQQDRIIGVLKSFDDKIECNRRINDNFTLSFLLLTCFVLWLLKLINDNLQQQAQALYKSWFIDFEPFKGDKFEDSELGMIPRGWSVKQLGEITTQVNEKVKERVDVKVLSPITTGELVLSEEYFTKQVFSESISKYIVVKPTYFAYNPARVNIGSLGMNEYGFDGCVSPVYVVFRCEDDYQYFFDLFRRTETFKEEVKARAIGGVRQSLTYKDFSLIKVVYPPIDVIHRFNQVYSRILAKTKHNKVETTRLASLRDTLLPKLMSGDLKIS